MGRPIASGRVEGLCGEGRSSMASCLRGVAECLTRCYQRRRVAYIIAKSVQGVQERGSLKREAGRGFRDLPCGEVCVVLRCGLGECKVHFVGRRRDCADRYDPLSPRIKGECTRPSGQGREKLCESKGEACGTSTMNTCGVLEGCRSMSKMGGRLSMAKLGAPRVVGMTM